MDFEYARNYRELYEGHWWWRAREELILATLHELRPERRWGSILDVGCGDGLFFEKLSALGDVEGIETDPAGVTPGGRWAHRIRVHPFDGSFDPGKRYGLVLMLDVLEHLENPLPALRRALELLDHSALLVVTVPAFAFLWTGHDVLNRHYRRYTRRSLAALVSEADGEIRSARYFYHWTVPFKLAAHWKESVFPAAAARPRIPPRWLNRLLSEVSRAEQKITSRVPLPFGSSLLAVVGPRRSGI